APPRSARIFAARGIGLEADLRLLDAGAGRLRRLLQHVGIRSTGPADATAGASFQERPGAEQPRTRTHTGKRLPDRPIGHDLWSRSELPDRLLAELERFDPAEHFHVERPDRAVCRRERNAGGAGVRTEYVSRAVRFLPDLLCVRHVQRQLDT